MSNSANLFHPLPLPKTSQLYQQFSRKKSIRSLGQKLVGIRCSSGRTEKEKEAKAVDYYKLLGVSIESTPQEIKEAYRRLQKKHHPDIAGQRGHEYTLMLNEAYHVLMREDLRRKYDFSTGINGFGSHLTGFSSWKGPLRPQALFVDENACIGCRECVHHASNTFVMDEALGCARVNVQFGDDDKQIEVAVESCPVNCIHWVDKDELPVLEYLIRPQPKEGYGVFGGGWERPSNVFMVAKSFNKNSKYYHQHHQKTGYATVKAETPAQAKARTTASSKLHMEKFSRVWTWLKSLASIDNRQ